MHLVSELQFLFSFFNYYGQGETVVQLRVIRLLGDWEA